MAKAKSRKEATFEPPLLFPVYQTQPLNLDERNELRAFMATSTFQKAIRNAYTKKPSSHQVALASWNEHSCQVSVNQLHRIQGWEMFEAAFFGQAEERVPKPTATLSENYQSP